MGVPLLITQERLYELMKEAIKESQKSIPEDSGVHPKVGAVLSDMYGNILTTSHRGESERGGHCEYILLKKAKQLGINTEEAVLFVTLEPCTSRSPGKNPCAQRIVDCKIQKVYVGMLDPNPIICGRGETFLRMHTDVERFPGELIKQIDDINKEFINLYRSELLPDSSLYVSRQISDLLTEKLQRSGINIMELPTDWDLTIEDIIDYCKSSSSSINICDIDNIVIDARNVAYDKKYYDYTYIKDSRGLSEQWVQEFKDILEILNLLDISKYSLINVGAGNGLEAKALFSDVDVLTLVDIGNKSLEQAKELMPKAKIIQNGAENIKEIDTGTQDIYVSLRTYQSSYFDINKSIREAYRVLKPNGAIIISIANGFVGENDVLIPGLVIPKTKVVDKNRSYDLTEQIRRKFVLLRFRNIGVRTGIGEIYIYGRRE
jgi:pyrimidine deaminase RibD-like protein/ubiquinone/menaquinone biosynthesis C-methylase UbiE